MIGEADIESQLEVEKRRVEMLRDIFAMVRERQAELVNLLDTAASIISEIENP